MKKTVFFSYVHYRASRAHPHPQSPKLQPPTLSYQLERNKGLGTRLFTWLLNRWSKVTTGGHDYVIVLNLLPTVLSLRLRTLGTKVMVAMTSTTSRCHGSRYCCDINKRFSRTLPRPFKIIFLVYFTGNSSK